ncbi:hypothetical protein RHGRI_008717 [Rhododendron griersonianum]|uniref:3-oxoacyl-[acyl-carrier-protein] synthase I, chloroplastic n=1 Tax=Rhododendron griersonianum TaxID=479676 RepID=A0AAV6L2R9_9ERIC|nr:hypothetical protein RHGRI_008717 [Rhododendron griersonianum]
MAEIASGSLMVFHSSHTAALHTWPVSSFPPNISSSRQKQSGQVRAMASPISASKRETDPKKRIVITGMGLVSVLGNDVDTFYNKLLNGESGIRRIDKFDASDYPVQIAGQVPDFSADAFIDLNKYQNLDDCWKFCLFAAKIALQDANLSPQVLKTMDRSKMGAVVGSGAGGIKTLYNAVDALLKQDYSKVLTSYYPNNMGPALLAIETGFTGPIYSISTACASSNYCLYAAANHIIKGEAQVMVAGGTDSGVIPSGICGFMACKALSSRNDEPQKASRPWDKGRDGFVLSEGCGVLVMESLEHATKRGANIIAEYLGGAISCDAHHLTDPRSDGSGVAACISKSLKIAGVSPEENLEPEVTIDTIPNGKIKHDVNVGQKQSGQVRAMASPISAPKRETDPKKRIVITGMGLVSVLGNDVDTFYNKLLNGESGIRRIDRFDASNYPVQIAGQVPDFSADGVIDGNRYQNLDDCWKFCLFAAKTALQDANLGPQVLKTLDRSKMGAVVGSGAGGIKTLYNAVDALLKQDYSKVLTSYYPNNMGPALLAIETGFTGPIYSISTACASSNYCLYSAANHIIKGEAQVMVAGGTDSGVIPSGICGFMACKALSSRNDEPQKASRPWDKGRDGFVLSEGSGVLVMESLEHATKRGANIIAEYLGGAISCDAHHLTDPRSDGSGVAACISKSLKIAGVSPEEVNYVNAHATSTRVGDLAEVSAIKKVFKNQRELKMNGTKARLQSMIGHAIGAAGALEAIATVKAIATGWLHPTINQYNLEPEVTIDTIPNGKIKHDVNVGKCLSPTLSASADTTRRLFLLPLHPKKGSRPSLRRTGTRLWICSSGNYKLPVLALKS